MIERLIGLALYRFFKGKYGADHPEHFEYGAAMKVSRRLTWWQGGLVVLGLCGLAGGLVFLVFSLSSSR